MQSEQKVIFRFSDVDLVTYLICKGNKLKNIELSYNKRFSEYKVFIFIEGYKADLLHIQDDFNKNKKKLINIDNFNNVKEDINNTILNSISVQTPHGAYS